MIFSGILFALAVLCFIFMCGAKEADVRRYGFIFGLLALAGSILVYLAG